MLLAAADQDGCSGKGVNGKTAFKKAINPMSTGKKLLHSSKTPTLVIDSSVIRKHLFKGWAVLNRVAVIARTGKMSLCIPWLVEQEVLTGIEKHVDELTGQEAFLTNVRSIAHLSSDVEGVRTLCDEFEKLRLTICDEARSRFRHWLEISQAERPAIKPEHTEKVFSAYFAGGLPFDKPKNREHLPDAFIYNAVLDLTIGDADVWFLGADAQLRESLRQTKKVRVFHDFYPLFADLQLPFNYEEHQALSRTLPDATALCELARTSLRSELCGQVLRYGVNEVSDAPRIQEVLRVPNLSVDRQSVMHIDVSALLIAFEADVVVRAAERLSDNRNLIERLSEFAVSIRGHFLVGIGTEDSDRQKRMTIEVDDFEVGEMKRSAAGEVLQPIAPQPNVVGYYEAEFQDVVKNRGSGLVVVVGSTLRNRRLVAEHIVAAALRNDEIALLNFRPVHETQLPSCESKSETDLSPLWNKARDAELHVIGLSSEDADWALEAIHYLEANCFTCFIVTTMKSANNRSAVVRYLANLPNLENNLERLLAVAWIQEVTAETITFAISQHGGWGDGSWEGVLRRDESLQRKTDS